MKQQRSIRAPMSMRPSTSLLVLLGLLVAGFMFASTAKGGAFARAWLVLVPERALHHPWQLLTTAFFHPSLGALVGTGLAILFFGVPAEQKLGRGRVLFLLGLSTVAGSLASAALGIAASPKVLLPGAGPASMAMIAAFGVAYASTPIALLGLQQMKASTVAIVFLGLSALMHVMSGDLLGLAGATAGAAVGAIGSLPFETGALRDSLARFRKWRVRRRYRVIPGGRDTRRVLH